MDFLHVEGFRKKFYNTEVLKGIDFSLQKGEILAIIGASGSGKTTLLRCLNFLETPDEGKVYLDGELLSDAKERYPEGTLREKRKKFGLVFQNFNLFPHYRAIKNVSLASDLAAKERAKEFRREQKRRYREEGVRFAGRLARRDGAKFREEALKESARRAEELLETVGLGDKKQSYPGELSGGQQQRVAIARALALDPEVLCFDEPTSALDPELTGEVLRVIRALKGRTMIIVTHEMKFAREVADKVLFMADGAVEEEGTPEEIFVHARSEKLRAFLKRENSGD